MNSDTPRINITSRDYWVIVIEMLQQNWALIEECVEGGVIIYFISDDSGVFDQIKYNSKLEATKALKQNGFWLYSQDRASQEFITPPPPPFFVSQHRNGLIYSSGRYWIK